MKIAIIGTGNVGGVLASQWSKAGHEIYLGVRDFKHFKGKALLKNRFTSIHTIAKAVKLSEVVLVALPSQYTEHLATRLGDTTDKVIIDASNAIGANPENYPTAYHVFEALTDAEVVKCFNSTGFENMENPDYGQVKLDMFMAGDSERAKSIATQLSKDAGFENCYDFGGKDQVVLLEQFALSWINLVIVQGMGRDIGFKLVQR